MELLFLYLRFDYCYLVVLLGDSEVGKVIIFTQNFRIENLIQLFGIADRAIFKLFYSRIWSVDLHPTISIKNSNQQSESSLHMHLRKQIPEKSFVHNFGIQVKQHSQIQSNEFQVALLVIVQ